MLVSSVFLVSYFQLVTKDCWLYLSAISQIHQLLSTSQGLFLVQATSTATASKVVSPNLDLPLQSILYPEARGLFLKYKYASSILSH